MTETVGRTARPTGRSYLSIREVLDLLIGDFPDVTISKIRFLEARGLIHPERTPSGYRKFYQEDVDRLRWILRQQRENYLPLNVIKVRLDGGDASSDPADLQSSLFETETEVPVSRSIAPQTSVLRGHPAEGIAPRRLELHSTVVDETADVESDDGDNEAPVIQAALRSLANESETATAIVASVVEPAAVNEVAPVEPVVVQAPTFVAPTNDSAIVGRSCEEVAAAIAAPASFVAELVSFGLIAPKEVAGVQSFDEQAVEVARLAHGFLGYGIEPRHLKSLQHAAYRESELFAQVVMPLLRQRNPEARTKAESDLGDLTNMGSALKSTFVRMELRNLIGG